MYSSDALVAPRPVRIAAFNFSPLSLRLSSPPQDGGGEQSTASELSPLSLSPVDRSTRSPRLSPRPSSEALDEFLSILRPAIPALFSPRPHSPSSLRPRVYNIPSLHDRALSLSSSASGPFADVVPRDGTRTPPAAFSRARSSGPDDDSEFAESADVPTPLRSFGPQASPISRIHTRNPFQRHPSYDVPAYRSPSTCPLPPPTPSEQLEVF